MSVTKEQCHFLAGHARTGVYDTAKIYSAWLQFRARALLARPRICTRLHTYTRHVQSWGRGSCPLWGVAGMESNSVHNLRSFVRATATGRDAKRRGSPPRHRESRISQQFYYAPHSALKRPAAIPRSGVLVTAKYQIDPAQTRGIIYQ